jgi:hypothetical protein
MYQTPPDKLTIALCEHMATQVNDGLYIVSMDHSPSEQLTGVMEDWHTTALILSSGFEHVQLANRLAIRLNPRSKALRKWNKRSKVYQRSFLPFFLDELREFPSVYVFAISAQESDIRASTAHFISELGLENYFRRVETPDKTTITIGPVINASTSEEFTIALSENRALMCLFVAHFVIRMKHRMYEAANSSVNKTAGHINWNFYGDKFPGPSNSDMDLMFQVLTSFDRGTGSIVWGYFKDGDTVETDLLADNLAGALSVALANPCGPIITPSNAGSTGFFYWEKWNGAR